MLLYCLHSDRQFLRLTFVYTAGHDDLDAERVSCLMNTHWNTVSSKRHHWALSLCFLYSVVWLRVERVLFSIPWKLHFHITFHVSRSGVRIPVEAIFSLFFLLPTFCNQSINRWRIFLNHFIDWLKWVVIGVTSQNIASTGVRTPDLETWNVMWSWNCHSTL